MVLPANAQRALEQVKTGLCILYGADYFTEEEWVKVDGLIHKGRYVFTNGPPNTFMDEELMTFDDAEVAEVAAPGPEELVLDTTNLSPALSEEPSAIFSAVQNDNSATTTPDAPADEANTSEVIIEKPSAKPTNGGLPLGYTEEQLEEVKAFNAGLTKAGQKRRPRYTQPIEESFPSPAWSEHGDDGLPTAAEQESRITTWADEVVPEGPLPVASPFTELSTAGDIPKLVEQFVQAHGRPPNVPNDVCQPNNPEYRGPRPDSRASSKNTKVIRKLFASPGTLFLAHSSMAKKSTITMEVLAGDQIQYIKHVSGIMHIGTNMRTKQQGQFLEMLLEPAPQESSPIEQRSHGYNGHGIGRGRGMTNSTVSHSLDKVEAINAAEWDRESDVSRPTTANPALPSVRGFGLAGSRFAAVSSPHSGPMSTSQNFTQAEIRKIIQEELAQSPKAQAQVHHSQTVAPHEGALTKIIPKTNTCWFWKTKNDCRFTAEECRDLHADLPPGELTNLRGGKPTWGALADALPPRPPAGDSDSQVHPNIEFKHFSKSKTCYYWAIDGKCQHSAEECRYLHEYTAAGVAPKPGGYSRKKDFNWARKSTPTVNEESERSPTAQQSDPHQPQRLGDIVTEEGWGVTGNPDELIDSSWDVNTQKDALENPNAAIWGAVEGSSAWDVAGDKYKPPHIKALEERKRIEAVGW